jgi:endonuclease YncB( thermonuclease family)
MGRIERWGIAAALTALLAPGSASAVGEARGPASAVDGDTLEIAGQAFHLRGIDAPEPGQECRWPNKTIDCGEIAKLALMDLLAGATVTCRPAGDAAADGGRTALCVADGFDLSANMVHTGWALADPQAGGDYAAVEARARTAQRGVWKGEFVPPWEWRARQ